MVDAAVANLAEDIYHTTKPMFAATDAAGGLSPEPSHRRGLIEELLRYVLKDGGRHESGRIVFEPDDGGSSDITVYFKVGTIRGAPSWDV